MGERLSVGFEDEFQTVDLVLASDATTKNVDAFCLSWIKYEKQLRKIVGNLLYQATIFEIGDTVKKEELRNALRARSNLMHDHFLGGIRKLTGATLKSILRDDYRGLKHGLEDAYGYRKKIFHGQQTGSNLQERDLAKVQGQIRDVCRALAVYGDQHFGFDGFARNSLRKTNRHDVTASVDNAINIDGWEEFIRRL